MFQLLHSIKVLSASQSALPASRLGMGKRLGGDTAKTQLNPTGQRDIPCHIMCHSEIKLEGSLSKVAVPQRLTGHQSAGRR